MCAEGVGLEGLEEAERRLVETEGYFHGALWRKGAEEVLAGKPKGAFLVRAAGPPQDLDLVLSIRVREPRSEFGEDEDDEDREESMAGHIGPSGVLHLEILVDSRGFFSVDGIFYFQELNHLIRQHLEEGEKEGLKSRRPVAFGQVCLSTPVGLLPWELLPGQLRQDRLLKTGRFGSLYQGRLVPNPSAQRNSTPVTIKVMDVRNDKQMRRMFLSDALASCHLPPDPRILKFFGCSLLEERIKMTKELVEVGQLRRFLAERDSRMPVAEALELGQQMASALVYVHVEGSLIHLDLTTHNFFLSLGGPGRGWRAKLGNFYHSRRVEGPREAVRLGAETLAVLEARWAAAEVLAGEGVRQAADVFSLATCVLELLKPPPAIPFHPALELRLPQPVLREHIKRFLRSPTPHIIPDEERVPVRLCRLLRSAWQLEPRHRPSADVFHREIALIATSRPTLRS